MKFNFLVLLASTALATIGCGGSSSSTSPTPTAADAGVTLTGSFGGTGSSLRSATAIGVDDIVVVVLDAAGVEITRVDVVSGRFTLRGLPTGSFKVRFLENDVVVGEETFDAIKVNQQISITLEMVNGSVRVVEERRNGIGHGDIEIEGDARSIQITTDPMTGSLEVNGYSIVTRVGETAIRKGNRALTLEDLRDGDQVHVKGEFETAADGSSVVFAREIKLQEDDIDDPGPTSVCAFPDPAKAHKILICHKGKTLSVSADAWSGHSGHGDTCGPCS